MGRKPNYTLYLAMGLILLGFAEDLTGALVIVGLATSALGLLIYIFRRKKR